MRRGEVWLIKVAQERFVRRLGKLSDTAMQEIAKALAVVLSIEI